MVSGMLSLRFHLELLLGFLWYGTWIVNIFFIYIYFTIKHSKSLKSFQWAHSRLLLMCGCLAVIRGGLECPWVSCRNIYQPCQESQTRYEASVHYSCLHNIYLCQTVPKMYVDRLRSPSAYWEGARIPGLCHKGDFFHVKHSFKVRDWG